MRRLVSISNRVYDAIIRYLAYFASAIILFIMLSISVDVVLRYSVNQTIKWVFEATEYSLLYVTLLASAWVLKKDGHVRLDLVINNIGEGPRRWVNIVIFSILAIVCLALTWFGTIYTIELIQRGVTIIKYYTLPQYAFVIIIPIGGFFLFIESLKKTLSYIREKDNNVSQGAEKVTSK